MKINLLIIFFLFLSLSGVAQDVPIHNQYFLNPYVYNPAFAGHNEYPVVFLTHRRQWIGIDGAPVSSNISFHTTMKEKGAIGVNIYTEKRGLLTTSSAEIALGYRVKFGQEQYVQFGIAAGVGNNSINLEETQNGGAVPLALSDNGTYLDGRFGIKIHLKNLNLGFALPSLFERDYFSDDNLGNFTSDPLSRYLAMASYKFIISKDNFAFEPHLLYHALGGDFTQIEAAGIFYIKDMLWAGASYRMDYGATGLLGIKIKETLTIGYAYEMATAVVSGFSDGSHEISLSLKLGDKKKPEPERIRRPRFDTQTERY